LHAPGDVGAAPVLAEQAEVDRDQVGGAAQQRNGIFVAAAMRTLELGLVIAGEQAIGLAIIAGRERYEPALEELLRRRRIVGRNSGGGRARLFPVLRQDP